MRIRLGALKRIIKEEVGRYSPQRAYPQVGGSSGTVPFATLKKRWMELSGGLEPDEVSPEDHEGFIAAIASELGVDEDRVREQVVEWGEAASLAALSGGSYAGPASDWYVEDDDERGLNEPIRP